MSIIRERRWANCDLLLQLERRTSMLRGLALLLLLADILQSAAPFSATHKNGISLESDKEAVSRQLGYLPPNFVKVSARNGNGSPVAIKTYPLDGGAPRRQAKAALSLSESMSVSVGTPFPTLYWLTCPSIAKAIAKMERNGYVSMLEDRLKVDSTMTDQLFSCHKEYARERWECLSLDDKNLLTQTDSSSVQRMRDVLESTGIAGTNTTALITQNGSRQPAIKCLHAHYADYRSAGQGQGQRRTENPVGRMVHELLAEQFPLVTL
jgi:hypothetical protein